QNKRYEPCYPTIARELKSRARNMTSLIQTEQAAMILNWTRTQWFAECLQETPAFQWMKQHKIYMDEIAVAQHYGLPTGYIDLTQAFDVASSFACCKYDPVKKRWDPLKTGEGVIYVIDQREILPDNRPIPICLQPFPRPSEQWGWVHEVTLGDDFDNL